MCDRTYCIRSSYQFNFRVLIECELIVILCSVELLVGGAESTTTDVIHLGYGQVGRNRVYV